MIKSLNIQNFQSHEKTQLSFHEGVNVIVGSSDSGKTAIIRALRWVVWNRPSGDYIRSSWGGDTSVSVGTEDATIIRSKSKQDTYQIRSEDKNLDFRAFGTNVPDEVQKLFNISEINLQNQFDSAFLLSETPGAVAAHFNKVAKLDRIDVATSAINGWIRGLKSDISHLEVDITTEKDKLSKFEHLEKFEIEVEVLEQMEDQLTTRRSRRDTLKKDIRRYTDLEEEIETLTPLLELEELVTSVSNDIAKRDAIELQKEALQTIIEDLEDLVKKEEEAQTLLPLEPLVLSLLATYEKLRVLKTNKSQIKYLLNQVTQVEEDILTTENNLKKIEERFHKEMPDVCPLCDQRIKK